MASCRSTTRLASDDWPTHAGERPTVVYRVDTRSPAEIFVFGFSAGTGMSLVNHVLAANEFGVASAFVATTDDPSVASRIAIHYRHHDFPVWIYEIRADGGFYGVAPSLRWIIDNEPDEAERAAWALETLSFQREWVAISRIPRENIRRAYGVDGDLNASDFRVQISDIDSNSLYVGVETRASDQIITS